MKSKTIFVLTDINTEKPPKSKKQDISINVLVFDANEQFIGRDSYNLKLNRWLLSRGTVKYWGKKSKL